MAKTEIKTRYESIVSIGCVVCLQYYGVYSPPEIHHLIGQKYRAMGKKAKDENTIGLCTYHHRAGCVDHPSIHVYPDLFNKKFGTQEELLKLTNELISHEI